MLMLLAGLDLICAQCVANLWIAAAVVLAGVSVLLWRRRGRQRPILRWALSGLIVVAVVLTASADSVNAYYGYLPTVGDVVQAATGDRQWVAATVVSHPNHALLRRADRSGVIVRVPIPTDPANGFGATSAIVYLPEQYFTQPAVRFPVVYLFHGSPGQASDWFHAGQAARDGRAVADEGHPAIIVAAPMSRSWTDDPECVDGAREKVESHLVDRIIPTIDASLRTDADRDGRVFAGMSAGGYCALNLGLRHRNLVATIIDMSGDTVPTHVGGAASLFGVDNPRATALVSANSPADYAARLTRNPPMRIWLDSGTGDTGIVREMSQLAPVLVSRGIDVVWRVRPGGHTYWVWTAAMKQALPWALGAPPLPETTSHSRPGP